MNFSFSDTGMIGPAVRTAGIKFWLSLSATPSKLRRRQRQDSIPPMFSFCRVSSVSLPSQDALSSVADLQVP